MRFMTRRLTCGLVGLLATFGFTGMYVHVHSQEGDGPAFVYEHVYATYQFNTLKNPTGLALMTDTYNGVSTLYIADSGNHVIRRFPPGGPLTTLGTIGTPGYVDGSFSSAQFNYPTGLSGRVEACVFLDPNTHQYRPYYQHIIYVNDAQNYVVRRLYD